MATGSGKTKVISLVITWCYFHKLYELDSKLSTNFLVIAPSIIVLDRLRTDFNGLKIFWNAGNLAKAANGIDTWESPYKVT